MSIHRIERIASTIHVGGLLQRAHPVAHALKLGDVLRADLPAIPANYDVDPLKLVQISIAGNDTKGDCDAVALWRSLQHQGLFFAGAALPEDVPAILAFYGRLSPDDSGLNPDTAAAEVQTNGFPDSQGVAHRVQTVADTGAGNIGGFFCGTLDEVRRAVFWMAGAVVGFNLPYSAVQDFQEGREWDVRDDQRIDGGHATFCTGYNADGSFEIITWGQRVTVTAAFMNHYLMIAQGFIPAGIATDVIDPAKLAAATAAIPGLTA